MSVHCSSSDKGVRNIERSRPVFWWKKSHLIYIYLDYVLTEQSTQIRQKLISALKSDKNLKTLKLLPVIKKQFQLRAETTTN